MEVSQQKSLERIVSQRALQMSASNPCQIFTLAFLCGVCLTYFCTAILGTSRFGELSTVIDFNSSLINTNKPGNSKTELTIEHREFILYSVWGSLLNRSLDENGNFSKITERDVPNVPKAPHLENCKLISDVNRHLDKRDNNEGLPPWTIWKGMLNHYPVSIKNEELRRRPLSENSQPPWIKGSDEENYPRTRQVQRDIWAHQHPMNCSDPSVKFLVADWERLRGFGLGAQIAGMCGVLAIAINEKRVLVTNYFNRADHAGCNGPVRSSWSCYFFPETSAECRERAFEIMRNKEAWEKGIVTVKENYTSKEIWTGRIPRIWGDPWSYLQPTTEVNGNLIAYHRKMDRRWWRAQAVRYFMRFRTEYTCRLLNIARHEAFGREAAKMVLDSPTEIFPQNVEEKSDPSDIVEYVWSNHNPWKPSPLLSIHVRMGDKAVEMKVVEFEEYMRLADRIRKRFPHLTSIWLSTEMQDVIDKTRLYPHWKFYYTNVRRQVGNMLMANYEASLGRKTSTNYPLVNFLMATEADFFVGALGSTWCFLIDGMRNTGGKVMAGYLSVNKDRFW